MKFLFIYPNCGKVVLSSKKDIQIGANLPPLGLMYLAKKLEINDHYVEIIDYNAQNIDKNQLKEKINSSDVVGMTIYSDILPYNNSIILSKLIKEIDPYIPLVIGGPHCTLFPEHSLNSLNADISVIGEGEYIITLIAEAIQGKRKLSTIPSICYKENNTIKKTNSSGQIDKLDDLPFPSRHLVEKYEYGYMFGVKMTKGKLTSFLTSRGCPHHCRFCRICYLLPKYKRRSLNNITQEIDDVINRGYKTIFFVDDNFLQKKKEVEKIMDYIIEKKDKIHIWIMEARVDSADKKLYQKMRDAGVESISYGIESGNQDVLDYYNKKITIPQIKYAVQLAKEMGFFVNASFILGAPIETKKHINNTIKFAKSLFLDSVIFYNLYYNYGASIWQEAVNENKIKPDEYAVIADSKRGLGNFTGEELIYHSNRAYKSYYYDTRIWYNTIRTAFIKKDFRYLKLGLKIITRK